jgi:hypothetical protein
MMMMMMAVSIQQLPRPVSTMDWMCVLQDVSVFAHGNIVDRQVACPLRPRPLQLLPPVDTLKSELADSALFQTLYCCRISSACQFCLQLSNDVPCLYRQRADSVRCAHPRLVQGTFTWQNPPSTAHSRVRDMSEYVIIYFVVVWNGQAPAHYVG